MCLSGQSIFFIVKMQVRDKTQECRKKKGFKLKPSGWGSSFGNACGAAATALAIRRDIVDAAMDCGSLNTLVAAAETTDLAYLLKNTGPFTLFAPSDEAFRALPPGMLESLFRPEHADRLKAILLYHVVPADVTAIRGMRLTSAKTLHGQTLSIRTRDGALLVNDGMVTRPELPAANGVVHVIDTVLLPSECASEYAEVAGAGLRKDRAQP
jgi:uncharacterized surface protein with fasciclin (FAS1) repeats